MHPSSNCSRRRATTWLCALALARHASAAPVPSARQRLDACDAVRNPGRPFSLTATLTEYREARQTDMEILKVYAKPAEPGRAERSLVQFVAPQRDANKILLKDGNDLWFYDPSSQATVRISAQQRLLGQAANGDVMTLNWAGDYDVTLRAEEDVSDGDRPTTACAKLALTARAAHVTYHGIDLWVARDSNRPVKARFHAASGTLLKTAYYRRNRNLLGAMRPTETVIIDGLDPRWVTVMRTTGHAWSDIPDAWLQRDYLPRFKPE